MVGDADGPGRCPATMSTAAAGGGARVRRAFPRRGTRFLFSRMVSGVILGVVGTAGTLTADRVFDVFGDHSYRMDLRG